MSGDVNVSVSGGSEPPPCVPVWVGPPRDEDTDPDDVLGPACDPGAEQPVTPSTTTTTPDTAATPCAKANLDKTTLRSTMRPQPHGHPDNPSRMDTPAGMTHHTRFPQHNWLALDRVESGAPRSGPSQRRPLLGADDGLANVPARI